jgi:hypothetical protein
MLPSHDHLGDFDCIHSRLRLQRHQRYSQLQDPYRHPGNLGSHSLYGCIILCINIITDHTFDFKALASLSFRSLPVNPSLMTIPKTHGASLRACMPFHWMTLWCKHTWTRLRPRLWRRRFLALDILIALISGMTSKLARGR